MGDNNKPGGPDNPDGSAIRGLHNLARVFPLAARILVVPIILIILLIWWKRELISAYLSSVIPHLGRDVSEAAFFSLLWALLCGLILLAVAFSFIPDIDEVRLLFLLILSGTATGWLIGMYLSPQSQPEQQAFTSFKTAVVGVFSGYLLSKLQGVFDSLASDKTLMDKKFLQRLMFAVVPMFLAIAVVYNVREYKELNVHISLPRGEGLLDATKVESPAEDQAVIPANTKVKFVAEARFPNDTSVTWKLEPSNQLSAQDCGKLVDGLYESPVEVPANPRCDIVAISNQDKTKSARLTVTLKKPEEKPPSSTANHGAATAASPSPADSGKESPARK
jgi:hypothetical protein